MNMYMFIVILGVLCLNSGVYSQSEAQCDMQPNSDLPNGPEIGGTVTFTLVEDDNVKVKIEVHGFNETDDIIFHGFHIHESGDMTDGCSSTGSHFNPRRVGHAGRLNETRHVGDLGNIEEDADGNVFYEFDDAIIKLSGINNIIDRAVVIHEKMDDLGVSGDPTGNAGARLACCVIRSTDWSNTTTTSHTTTTVPEGSASSIHAHMYTTVPVLAASIWFIFKLY